MAVITEWRYYSGGSWILINSGQKFYFGNSDANLARAVINNYQYSTHIVDSSGSLDQGICRNVRYISPATADKGAGEINIATLINTDCTVQIKIYDDAPVNSYLENVNFFADDGTSYVNAPPNCCVVALEVSDQGVRTNRIGGDTGGLAWFDDFGIGGISNALSLSDRSLSDVHYYYIGLSCKGTVRGINDAIRLNITFDII